MTRALAWARLLVPRSLRWAEALKAAALTPADYEAKFQALQANVEQTLQGYASQLADGSLSPAQFRQRMTATIRANYDDAYRLGMGASGGVARLTDDDWAVVHRYLNDEITYIDNFAREVRRHIEAGDDYSDDYLAWRTGFYSDSLRGLYFSGYANGANDGALFEWTAHADACEPCQAMADGSPYTADELDGQMPGADVCDGLDKCQCELEQVAEAAGDQTSDEEADAA